LRNATPDWPRPFNFSPSIINVMLMTFVLISSSLTMLIGVRMAQAGNKSGAFRWIFITAAAGILFALLHLREWLGLIAEGVRLFQNPWGAGTFGAAFFSITGLHLTHVVGGVVAMVVVGLRYRRGRYNADDIEILGLYSLRRHGLDVRGAAGLLVEREAIAGAGPLCNQPRNREAY